MVIKYDYSKKEVDACLSVLVELMTILGEFRDNIVLVGGWIPYFLMEKNRHEHVGKTGGGSLFYNPTYSINYWGKRDQPVKTRLLYQGGFDYE